MFVTQLPWPHFCRTKTLDAATYCAPVSGISAGQEGNGPVESQSTDHKVGVLVLPSAPGIRPLPIVTWPLLLPTPRTSLSGQQLTMTPAASWRSRRSQPGPAAAAHPSPVHVARLDGRINLGWWACCRRYCLAMARADPETGFSFTSELQPDDLDDLFAAEQKRRL